MRFRPVFFAALFALSIGCVGLWLSKGRLEPDRRIVSIAVSSSSRWVAAGTPAGAVTVLDQDHAGHLQRIHAGSGELNDLQFSPDERTLAIANRSLTVFSVDGSGATRSLRSDGRNYGTVRFSADGKRLLTVTGSATIEVLEANSGELQLTICCSTIAGEVAFSPDGSLIVTAGHWPAFWDAQSGKLIRRLTADREFETFRPIAFDRLPGLVVMGSQDGRVYAWDLPRGQRAKTSPGHPGYVDSITIPAESRWIAYAALGGPVYLWNPESGAERLLGPRAATSNLVAGSEAHSILFGTEAGFVELWDIVEEKLLRRYDLR